MSAPVKSPAKSTTHKVAAKVETIDLFDFQIEALARRSRRAGVVLGDSTAEAVAFVRDMLRVAVEDEQNREHISTMAQRNATARETITKFIATKKPRLGKVQQIPDVLYPSDGAQHVCIDARLSSGEYAFDLSADLGEVICVYRIATGRIVFNSPEARSRNAQGPGALASFSWDTMLTLAFGKAVAPIAPRTRHEIETVVGTTAPGTGILSPFAVYAKGDA